MGIFLYVLLVNNLSAYTRPWLQVHSEQRQLKGGIQQYVSKSSSVQVRSWVPYLQPIIRTIWSMIYVQIRENC